MCPFVNQHWHCSSLIRSQIMFFHVFLCHRHAPLSSLARAFPAHIHVLTLNVPITTKVEGAQWLSGRVLDSRPKGRGFEPHRRHCVVVLEQDTFILA